LTYKELKSGKEITPTSENNIANRKEFNLDKDIVNHFCRFASQFFKGV